MLIWNVLLTIAAGFLLVMHFSSGKNSGKGSKIESGDTTQNNKEFRIAYFEMDSVEANFEMVKQVKSELTAKEQAITNEMDRMGKEFQDKYVYYQNKANSGNLSQEESETASAELKALEEKMRNRKSQLDQEYFELSKKKQSEIKTKIQDFIKDYNKEKKYTYIVSDDPGLFYYLDKTYNITTDVIKGLNDLYKTSKK